ncbi:MAG: 4-(cytidine 5'-diphospho)-2-C-methyl-D-erythritol kinase [Gemmatimonadota bacterium]|nr:4-(cytidine 5'-diphospho)-2-C-methyl-D-erythritol kinase [Gemmatimonadota bacterium]
MITPNPAVGRSDDLVRPRSVDRLTVAAHAKANLLLRVLARETSGFHQLETLFTLLELADQLTVERIPSGIELVVEDGDTGPTESNLAYRAAAMVLDATNRRFGVRLHLVKRIPVGAGLGGGSADGAAALHAVNALAGNTVPRHEILQMAARLGSDVPFLASGVPLALAWGRGERMFRLPPPPSAPALLVLPPFGIQTGNAYDLLSAGRDWSQGRGSVVLELDALTSWGGIARLGGNDFEVPVFGKEPGLRDLFERLCHTGPLLARLSGSGSALLAIYKNARDRDGAALEIGERNQRVIKTATRAGPGSEVKRVT